MFAVNLASERCAGFERSSIETSRLEKRKKENPSWFSVDLFFFSEIGSGAYGHHPLIGRGWPVGVSACPQHSGVQSLPWLAGILRWGPGIWQGDPEILTLSLPAGWQEAPGSISALLRSIIGDLCQAQRFDLRFFRPFRADLSIRKSSSFFPPLIAATSQRGLAPRPAQVSPDGPRYFGGTFLPFKTLRPPRTTLRPPTKAIALSILPNCVSISARRSRSVSSTRFRRSMSASTVIRDRFTFAIVISGAKAFSL
jgi:hypothetical protein